MSLADIKNPDYELYNHSFTLSDSRHTKFIITCINLLLTKLGINKLTAITNRCIRLGFTMVFIRILARAVSRTNFSDVINTIFVRKRVVMSVAIQSGHRAVKWVLNERHS